MIADPYPAYILKVEFPESRWAIMCKNYVGVLDLAHEQFGPDRVEFYGRQIAHALASSGSMMISVLTVSCAPATVANPFCDSSRL